MGVLVMSAMTSRPVVVLVEDNDDLRQLFEFLLDDHGYQVVTAVDGPSGVECVLANQPKVALIDVGLPGFDGHEVARQVRAALGDTVSLVALTGFSQAGDLASSRQAGFDHHLAKPVEVDDLLALLERLAPLSAA